MKFLVKNLPAFLAILLIFACSQKPAKVVNHSRSLYSKNSELSKKNRNSKQKNEIKNNQIEVNAGDTIYSISKKYHVELSDLIKENNLTPPYILKPKTKLISSAPTYHEVKNGETLYAISRLYNMKVDNLIEINNLQAPYSIKTGDKIKVSKFANNGNAAPANDIAASAATSKQKSSVIEEKPLTTKNNITQKPIEKKPDNKVGFIAETLDKFNHFSWPARGQIISKFGPKKGGLYNDGINIKASEGAPVKSSEDGVVAYVGNELKGYGNLVIIKHSGGWITAYAHLKKSLVQRGQKIKKGEQIGAVGSTGNVTSAQLYFGLRKGRDAVNPENYLK